MSDSKIEWPTCLRVRQFPDSVHVGETTNG